MCFFLRFGFLLLIVECAKVKRLTLQMLSCVIRANNLDTEKQVCKFQNL